MSYISARFSTTKGAFLYDNRCVARRGKRLTSLRNKLEVSYIYMSCVNEEFHLCYIVKLLAILIFIGHKVTKIA